MSDEDKTENPTEKKISDALEKGNTPFSKEIPVFASTTAILAVVALLAPDRVSDLARFLTNFVERPEAWTLNTGADANWLANEIFRKVAAGIAPVIFTIAIFGLAGSLGQNRIRASLDRIKPKLSRISPKEGAKRIFGARGLFEFLKSIIKIGVVSAVALAFMAPDYFRSIALARSAPVAIVPFVLSSIASLVGIVLAGAFVIAFADLLWSRHSWFRQLKMTPREIKDEHKQAEGDPILKSKIRSVARDRVRRSMMQQVPKATLVIANPTHYAVALKYNQGSDPAPMVVAKGQNLTALRIREIAEQHDVPVIEDKLLARSIYAQVPLDSAIPEEFYAAVAELIRWISDLDAKTKTIRR